MAVLLNGYSASKGLAITLPTPNSPFRISLAILQYSYNFSIEKTSETVKLRSVVKNGTEYYVYGPLGITSNKNYNTYTFTICGQEATICDSNGNPSSNNYINNLKGNINNVYIRMEKNRLSSPVTIEANSKIKYNMERHVNAGGQKIWYRVDGTGQRIAETIDKIHATYNKQSSTLIFHIAKGKL